TSSTPSGPPKGAPWRSAVRGSRRLPPRIRSVVLWIILLIAVAGVLCVVYGVVIERRWYRVRRYRLDILPAAGGTQLRVLHLSDLHLVRRDRKMPAFLSTLPEADVTVLTGDVVGEPEAMEHAVAAL